MTHAEYFVEPLSSEPDRTSVVDQAATVLADAFEDYPWTRWTVDAHNRWDRLHSLYSLMLTSLVVPYGAAWVAVQRVLPAPSTERRATKARRDLEPAANAVAGELPVVGVAAWLRPDSVVPERVLEDLHARTAALRGARARAAEVYDAAVSPHAFRGAHWYLGTIGVAPGWRGRGVGTALLTAGLTLADCDGCPARLETSSIRNLDLYRQHGFDVVAEVGLPQGSPPCWVMHRAPVTRA